MKSISDFFLIHRVADLAILALAGPLTSISIVNGHLLWRALGGKLGSLIKSVTRLIK